MGSVFIIVMGVLCVNRLMVQSYDAMNGENRTFEGSGIDLSYF